MSLFGELTGLALTASPKRLELAPYTVATLTRQPEVGNPLLDASSPGAKAGLDMKYALTSGLTLTATINPDFGQVEADPAVVNLSAFETFFSERRAFFVEGAGAFRFDSDCLGAPCTTLYTRRIGRAPQGSLPSGDDIYTSSPLQTTILGAAKVTGRAGPFAIGLMQAVTQEETGIVLEEGGRFEHPVEPLANYTVARVRRDFPNQSAVGGILTFTKRRLTENLRSLPDTALVGGMDWDLRFRRMYGVTGYWAASTVQGTTDAITALQQTSRHYYQRPDAKSFALDESLTALNGSSGRIGLVKTGGSRVRFNANVGYMSPGFELNDVGYLQRADQRWTSNWLHLRNETPTRRFRQRYLNFNQWASWNADGDRVISGSNVNGNVQFTNNWRVGGGLGYDWRVFDDRLTRGGPGGLAGEYTFFWSFVESDDRKPVAFELSTSAGRDGHGSWHRDHEFDVTFRPTTALELTAWRSRECRGARQPVARADRRCGDVALCIRAAGPDDGGGHGAGELHHDTQPVAAAVRGALRVRWRLPRLPGARRRSRPELRRAATRRSTTPAPILISMSARSGRPTCCGGSSSRGPRSSSSGSRRARARSPVGNFRLGRDFGAVFRAPARNVFLVKMSYWMNY